jgi:rhamnulokinase
MPDPLYIAVDLGAGSGRVFLAAPDRGEFLLEEISRFQYPPSESDGHLRWNLPEIFEEIKEGLRKAAARARELNRPICSMGVDSWGVDYGLIDAAGNLVELPICYRDARTQRAMKQVFADIPREEIFLRTGIQFLPFNTIFQLWAHAHEGIPTQSDRLLLIPDLINFLLTGKARAEYTNATTTQMLNARTSMWDDELLDRLVLPRQLLADVIPAGSEVGRLRTQLADELGIDAINVVAPATHDTGSAVAGAPLKDGWAYISSGTWSLVGLERAAALINEEVARQNFTNEGGAFDTFRFLKNVMGLWILESCRKEWQQHGATIDYNGLLREVAAMGSCDVVIFPDDERFLNPPSMLEAIATQLRETEQTIPAEPARLAKAILDSLAFRYASVLRTIESLTNQRIEGVQIIGGGGQNSYLNQATANASGLPVSAGPVEATIIGNVLVQSIAHGQFASLAEARAYVASKTQLKRFTPEVSASYEEAKRRYAVIETSFLALTV